MSTATDKRKNFAVHVRRGPKILKYFGVKKAETWESFGEAFGLPRPCNLSGRVLIENTFYSHVIASGITSCLLNRLVNVGMIYVLV